MSRERRPPRRFERNPRRTPAGEYDSTAARYITRSSTITPAPGDAGRTPRTGGRNTFTQLGEELGRLPPTPVQMMNSPFRPEARVYTAPDGSKVIAVSHRGSPEHELWLPRFTGPHSPEDQMYADYGRMPPDQSRERPLEGNPEPPKNSLITGPGIL